MAQTGVSGMTTPGLSQTCPILFSLLSQSTLMCRTPTRLRRFPQTTTARQFRRIPLVFP